MEKEKNKDFTKQEKKNKNSGKANKKNKKFNNKSENKSYNSQLVTKKSTFKVLSKSSETSPRFFSLFCITIQHIFPVIVRDVCATMWALCFDIPEM